MKLLTLLELECPNKYFKEKNSNTPSETQIENISLSTQFLIDIGATYSVINCDTFTEIKKIQPFNVMPLKKSRLAANRHALSLRREVMIQSAFDVECICVFEHVVYASESPAARTSILEMNFLTKFGEFVSLKNPMLNLTVFPDKYVEL